MCLRPSPDVAGLRVFIVMLARFAWAAIEAAHRGVHMGLVHDPEVWRQRLAALPLASYGAGETVFAEGTKTGRLLILKSGAVAIVKGGTEIATVAEPGAVFGELSALLDQPHSADVRSAGSVGVSRRRRRGAS